MEKIVRQIEAIAEFTSEHAVNQFQFNSGMVEWAASGDPLAARGVPYWRSLPRFLFHFRTGISDEGQLLNLEQIDLLNRWIEV